MSKRMDTGRRRASPRKDEDWFVPEPYDRHDPDFAPLANAVDFDDEQEEDQRPLDVVEAIEAGVDLDDPEAMEP